MAQAPDSRERVPTVHTDSYHDKHSGHTIKFGVTKDDDGEWTTRSYAKDAREKPKFVDAPEPWQQEWQARRHRVRTAKSLFKSLMDTLDFPILDCPVCGGDSVHKVTNEAVCEAAHGNIPDYENIRDYAVYWCSDCSVNFKKSGDYNYSSRVIYADVFDRDAPSAHISRSFSLAQDRKRKRILDGPEKYQEKLTEFHQDLLDVRRYVQENEDVEFDYL